MASSLVKRILDPLQIIWPPETPETPSQNPSDLGDFNFSSAEEGVPYQIVFGTRFIEASNVTWADNLTSREIKD